MIFYYAKMSLEEPATLKVIREMKALCMWEWFGLCVGPHDRTFRELKSASGWMRSTAWIENAWRITFELFRLIFIPLSSD